MVDYNAKAWLGVIFKFHRADTLIKLLPLILGVGLYSVLVAWGESNIDRFHNWNHLKNISMLHSILGFALSMLLVFRTNTAYERWWEGRKAWGSLVNSSRNLAIKLNSFLPLEMKEQRQFFKLMIGNYGFVLKNHLRKTWIEHEYEERPELSNAELIAHEHKPNKLANEMNAAIHKLYISGTLKGEQLLMVNQELSNFAEVCGACERIANTPIPFSYSSFIKKFIFIYIITLPLGYVFTLGYFVVPVVMFICYVLLSLELIAEEIEHPFGVDANDLPTDQIASGIRKSVSEILT
jgi:putative membrane protein